MAEERIIQGRYKLVRALQSGPLATTHLADDTESGDPVVLKEIAVHARPTTSSPRDVFKRLELLEREGKLLKHLDHPRIPRFIDAFQTEEDGRVSLWLVQEYREGHNLHEAVEDGWHGSAEDVERILREVAAVLGYLHGRVPPIVHRDVKPANIVLEPDGAVSLVDLGAACTRVLSQKEGSTIIGTPGYVPLEQFAGQAVPASDVYALGMVGVYMVTHAEPLSLTGDDGRVRYRHLTSVDHPTLLDTIDRMIEPLVANRLSNMRAVIDSLDGNSETPEQAAPHPVPARPRTTPGFWVGAAAAVLGLAGLAFGVAAYLDNRGSPDGASPPLFALAENEVPPTDEQVPYPEESPSEALPSETVTELPRCSVERNGQEPAHCARYASVLEPIVTGPGRIRTLLDDLPETIEEPELSGWLAEGEITPLWVVDFTMHGPELIGAIGCPDDTAPTAAALGADGSYHLACADEYTAVHHVVLDARRGRARTLGSYTLTYDETLEPALTATPDEYGPGSDRPVLAVPDRGPALLVYPAYSTMEDSLLQPRVQPLARGARPFSLFPSSQLEDIGDWQLYEDGGLIYAVVHARSRADGVQQLYRVRVSSTGTQLVGRFDLPVQESGQLGCHELSTADAGTGLVFRAPNEFGDRQLSHVVPGGRAIPGPTAAPREANVCADAASIFVRRGTSEVELQTRDTATARHRVTCAANRCLLAYATADGIEVVQLDLP